MNFYKALASLVGTIVGVGIFGLPYAFLKSGIILGVFYFILIFLIVLLNHLFFGEIILRTKENHRFIGYLKKYLGKYWFFLGFGSLIFGVLGSLVAYMIIGGQFLQNIFNGILDFSVYKWSILFWLMFSFLVLGGIQLVAQGELFLNIFLILVIFLIFIIGISKIDIINFSNNLLIKDTKDFFFPYGVILYALLGTVAIPEICQILKDKKKKIKKVIVLGTLIPAILYLIFIFWVIGMTGQNITEDVFSGLKPYLPKSVIILGSIFGFLAVATSFIIFGLYLRHTFFYDLNINKNLSVLIVVFSPLILFLTLSLNFVGLIGFVGAIFGGIDGILMILLYKKIKRLGDREPEYSLNISNFTLVILILLFLFGIIHQIIYSI